MLLADVLKESVGKDVKVLFFEEDNKSNLRMSLIYALQKVVREQNKVFPLRKYIFLPIYDILKDFFEEVSLDLLVLVYKGFSTNSSETMSYFAEISALSHMESKMCFLVEGEKECLVQI